MLEIVRNNQCIRRLYGILLGVFVALLITGGTGMCAKRQTTVSETSDVKVANVSDISADRMSMAESQMGDLFADAVRASVKADIGFIASSEIRSKAPISSVTSKSSEDISTLVNYPEDTVTVLQITGKQIVSALEQSLSNYPKPTLRFLQVSGLSFTFNPDKPQGSRIVSVQVGDAKLSNTDTYTVAVTRSLARGALGYWKVWSRDSIKAPDNPPTVVDAVNAYLRKNAALDYSRLDRIVIAGQQK